MYFFIQNGGFKMADTNWKICLINTQNRVLRFLKAAEFNIIFFKIQNVYFKMVDKNLKNTVMGKKCIYNF